MICYLQLSKSTKKLSFPLESFYRDCFKYEAYIPKSLKPGYIYGTALIIGQMKDHKFMEICDPATSKWIKTYKHLQNLQKDLICNIILDIYIFHKPVKGISNGNLPALKISSVLQKELHRKIKNIKPVWLYKLQAFDATKDLVPQQRILILRKEAMMHYLLKIKPAEYRTYNLGRNLIPKITSKKDFKQLKTLKKKTNTKNVSLFVKCSNTLFM